VSTIKLLWAGVFLGACVVAAQTGSAPTPGRPDPREIPVPAIRSPMGRLPGVNQLPSRPEMPDVMVMNDGTRVIVTGASRSGKSAMIPAAFDDRLMGAPAIAGGGGMGAYRRRARGGDCRDGEEVGRGVTSCRM